MLESYEVAELPWIPFRSLIADFRAAVWCERRLGGVDDASLLADFHQVHESFVRAIGRRRPELFRGVDRAVLLEVVRKWITLYCRGVADARARFPRTADSPDLMVAGRNWSETLGIAYEGLDRLDVVSRYAEFWAERTVTWLVTAQRGRGIEPTYEDRLAFIGTPYYTLAETLMAKGRVMLADGAANGMPSFDMRALFRAIPSPTHVEEWGAREGWSVTVLEPGARKILWEAARQTPSAIAEVHDGL